jgi:RNA polymerase sigma-70 factor (ECF subfamily)
MPSTHHHAVKIAPMTATPTSDPSPDDQTLVERARRGDVDAFGALYRQEVGRVFALCLRMCGDPVRARELVQDVFVRAWERLASFRGDSAFSSWLHRLAVNVVLTEARGERRRKARVTLGGDEDEAGWELRGATRPDDAGSRIDLERAIAKLPPGARRVFVLHDIEGYRHEEISRLTGSAEGTLRAQLHRARKLLMEALTK